MSNVPFKQLERDAGLQHAGGSNGNAWCSKGAAVENGIGGFGDMLNKVELERATSFFEVAFANVLVHEAEVRVVRDEALLGHVAKVEDGDVFQPLVSGPLFFEYEHELLRSTNGKHWHECVAAAGDCVFHILCKKALTLLPTLIVLRSISALNNENVWRYYFVLGIPRQLGHFQVPVLVAAVVARVQHTHAVYLYHEHGGAQHVSRIISSELDAVDLNGLMVLANFDFLQTILDVLRRVQGLVRAATVAAVHVDNVIANQFENGFRWMRHKHLAFECRAFCQIRNCSGMVYMKVRNESNVYFGQVPGVEKREGGFTRTRRVRATVQHDCLSLVLDHDTRTTNLLART